MTEPKKRSDADRRVRQSERLARLLRLLMLINSRGRWDAKSLTEELQCSRRTIYRLITTLASSGVPVYFCENDRCYRIRPGFKMKAIEFDEQLPEQTGDLRRIAKDAKLLLQQTEALSEQLRAFCQRIEDRT